MAAICIPTRQRTVKRLKTPDMLWVGRRGFLSRQEKRGRLGEGERSLEEKKKKKGDAVNIYTFPSVRGAAGALGVIGCMGVGGCCSSSTLQTQEQNQSGTGKAMKILRLEEKDHPKARRTTEGVPVFFGGAGPGGES